MVFRVHLQSDPYGGRSTDFKSRLKSFMDAAGLALGELKLSLNLMKRNPFSFVGIMIIVFFIGIALMAPLIAPPEYGADPYILKIRDNWHSLMTPPPTPPSPDHPFGTVVGYDIYYACIWGTRTAFRVSLEVTLIALAIGLFIGCLAGYFGGLDSLLMWFTDIFFAFPSFLLAMLLIVMTEPSWWGSAAGPIATLSRLNKVILVLAFTGWPIYARLIRAEVMKVKNESYVEAAKAVGCSNFRIITRHILPNAVSPIIAMTSLNIGGVVLATATLSFLGIGIPVGYAAWGPLIASSRNYIISIGFQNLYTFIIPSIFIITFISGWTLLGDTLRDILDPKMRRM